MTATLFKGLLKNPSVLKTYFRKLKKRTRTGSSLKDDVLEIKGDFKD